MPITIKRVANGNIAAKQVHYGVEDLEENSLEKTFGFSSVELYEELADGTKQDYVTSVEQANSQDNKTFIIEGVPIAENKKKSFSDVCSSSGRISLGFSRRLQVPVYERDPTFHTIYKGVKRNFDHSEDNTKGMHTFFLLLLGSGMGKTTILSETREKCIELAKKNGDVNLERAISEGIEICLDFGNGDAAFVGEEVGSSSQFLSARLALRAITGEEPIVALPDYNESTFNLPLVMKEISKRLHAKAGNDDPKVVFIFLDEIHMAGKFTQDFASVIGTYMCTTRKDKNHAFEDGLVLVPIFAGTLLNDNEMEATLYKKEYLNFNSLSWKSVTSILKGNMKVSKYSGSFKSINNWIVDTHFRTVAHTYGTFPRGLEFFIEAIFENNAADLDNIDLTQLSKIEKSTEFKILERYQPSELTKNLPGDPKARFQFLLAIFCGAPEAELDRTALDTLKRKGLITKEGNTVTAPYPVLSAVEATEPNIPLSLPKTLCKNFSYEEVEETIISLLHSRLMYYRGKEISIGALFPGSLSSKRVLETQITVPTNPTREDDALCLKTALSSKSSASIFKCKTTNDKIDARIQIKTNFLIQIRGSHKDSSGGCHDAFKSWKSEMSGVPGFHVYFTTKKMEDKHETSMTKELTDDTNRNIIFISKNQLVDFLPSFLYRILIEWEYSNEFPYSSMTIRELTSEYEKIFNKKPKEIIVKLPNQKMNHRIRWVFRRQHQKSELFLQRENALKTVKKKVKN